MAGAGSKTAVNLVRMMGDAETVYKANAEKLKSSGAVADSRVLARLAYKDMSEVENIIKWCDDNGVRIIVPTDLDYPRALLSLQDAPMALYAIGKLPDFENYLCCAVVGTRNMSEYGKNVAYELGASLADKGACVVSGLALGIDGMAMAGAVESGGATVAILGCGIDVIYPRQHEKLFHKVLERGCVITEYAPGVSPHGYNFPVRNRLISGMCQAVCVIEGNMRSGSLITARHAVYQGRSLYAVPGRIGEEGSEGPNALIKEGATVLNSVDDIIADFEFVFPHTLIPDGVTPHISPDEVKKKMSVFSRNEKAVKERKEKKANQRKQKKGESPFPKTEKKENASVKFVDFDSLGDLEKRIFEYMKADVPMLAEEIAEGGFELSQVMVSLTLLEISGAVEAGAGGYYLKRAADYGGDPEYITEDDDGL